MSSYLVFQAKIKDTEKFQNYVKGVGPTLTPFCGEVVFRGKAKKVIAGNHQHQILAVLKFPDQETSKGWYNSDAYQALAPNRDEAIDFAVVSYKEHIT